MRSSARRILGVLLAAVCLLSLSACHGSKGMEAFEVPESFDETKEYEISFWAKNDTNKAQVAVYERAIRDFEALYPNIKVNLRLYTDYGRIYNDVITNIATNTTPNVCITYPDHIATYRTGTNTVAPLDGLIADAQYGLGGSALRFDSVSREEIVPQFLDEGVMDGVQYAIPYMRSTEACYVNKTYVEKLGFTLPETLTWDFVWEVAEAAAAKDAEGNYLLNGQKVMIPYIHKSTDNMMIQMLRQLDAPYSNDAGEILLFNDTTRGILKAVAEHAATGVFSTFKISSYPANYLNAGQCVFAVDSTAGATWMGTHAPLSDIAEDKLVAFETVVMPIPQFDTAKPRMISQGPSICVFNKRDSQEVLASWLFAQFMLTNSVQIGYAQTEGYAPVTLRAQNDAEYLDYISRSGEDNNLHYDVKIQATKLLTENVDNTFVTPVFNGSASLRDAAGQLIENTTKSVRRGEAVDDAYITALYESVNALYRLDQRSTDAAAREELGALPNASRALLITLAAVWTLIVLYRIIQRIKGKIKRTDH